MKTYEEIETDKYHIFYDDEVYEFDYNEFKNNLYFLSEKKNLKIDNLDEDMEFFFKNVVESIEIIKNSKTIYNQARDDIYNIFYTNENILPNTIESYFVGCYNNKDFDDLITCNPRCTPSIKWDETITECDKLVLNYNKKFEKLNENEQSEHAIIYIDDPNFEGFREKDIKKLKNYNIQKITLIYSKKSGKLMKGKIYDIDNLPKKIKEKNESNLLIISIILIIVFFIIFFIFF